MAAELDNFDFQDLRDLEVHECVGLTIGIVCAENIMDPIQQGRPLPQCAKRRYPTEWHGQTAMGLEIVEGPWKMVKWNHPLGKIEAFDIPPGTVGEDFIKLVLTIADDSVLTTEAKVDGAKGSSKSAAGAENGTFAHRPSSQDPHATKGSRGAER
jgi:molecular chaperone DnaK (HSP70)